MASQDTIFTNNSGNSTSNLVYLQGAFPDFTYPATSNGSFGSSTSNNPMGFNFANTDLPQFGAKVLIIKDLLLISDRSKWINNKQTYQVIFTEPFPQINCYAFGDISIIYNSGNMAVYFKQVGDGISVNGVIRQVAFIVNTSILTTATAQIVVDGTNEGTINFGNAASTSTPMFGIPVNVNNFVPLLHNSTPESYAIHDIRATALQADAFVVNGIVVYFQNSGSNIDQFPGQSYVNKTLVTTTVGATMSIPTMGSSLGGKATIFKTIGAGYTVTALSATTLSTLGTGSSGTNLLALTTGTGASFGAGYGLVVTQGSSVFISPILSMSTDSATLGNTLGFGTSTTASVYVAWKGGSASQPINASLMVLAYQIDLTQWSQTLGFTNAIYEPSGNYCLWGNNIGCSVVDAVTALGKADGNNSMVFLGASGMFQVDGYFSAAEIETIGFGIFSATISINGFPNWSQNAGQTGSIKKTIFTDAGPGWNSFSVGVGASIGNIGFQRINLYQRRRDTGFFGASFGASADFDICQTYSDRGVINASMMPLGGNQRVYADQLYFTGPWVRSYVSGNTSCPGNYSYVGVSTTSVMTFQYFGKNVGIVGSIVGGSLTLDGNAIGTTANVMQTGASLETWHTLQYTNAVAASCMIQAIDFSRSNNKFKVDANVMPTPPSQGSFKGQLRSCIKVIYPNGYGSSYTVIRSFLNQAINTGAAISYIPSSVNGDAFIINEPGLYSIQYIDNHSGAGGNMGISVNSNQLTSSVYSINPLYVLGSATLPADTVCLSVPPVILNPGDVVRAHNGTNLPVGTTATQFIITKVSN